MTPDVTVNLFSNINCKLFSWFNIYHIPYIFETVKTVVYDIKGWILDLDYFVVLFLLELET